MMIPVRIRSLIALLTGSVLLGLAAGPVAAQPAAPQPVALSLQGTQVPGLFGEYFDHPVLDGPALHRVDPVINFYWGQRSPLDGIGTDQFSVRWTGFLIAPITGPVTFITLSNDGVQMWIDDTLVLKNWTEHDVTADTVSVEMEAGRMYPLRVEYFDAEGEATISLQWEYEGQLRQVVPTSALWHDPTNQFMPPTVTPTPLASDTPAATETRTATDTPTVTESPVATTETPVATTETPVAAAAAETPADGTPIDGTPADEALTSTPGPTLIPVDTRDPLPPLADPAFEPDQLPAAARAYYDRMWAALSNPDFYPGWTGMEDGETYRAGRSNDSALTALSLVLRATGDPAVLEEFWRVTELARAALIERGDPDGDGYLQFWWFWSCDSSPGQRDCYTDKRDLDESLLFGAVGHWAYVLWTNRELDPRYDDAAAFWLDWLEGDLAKWQARFPESAPFRALDKDLTHAYSNLMRGYWYLWRMTGDDAYRAEAERRAAMLQSMVERQGEICLIEHRVPEGQNPAFGPHPTTYAIHTFGMWADLILDGMPLFSDADMACFAAALRDNVLIYGTERMAEDLAGNHTDSYSKYTIYAGAVIMLWDTTDELEQNAEAGLAAYTDDRFVLPAVLLVNELVTVE